MRILLTSWTVMGGGDFSECPCHSKEDSEIRTLKMGDEESLFLLPSSDFRKKIKKYGGIH